MPETLIEQGALTVQPPIKENTNETRRTEMPKGIKKESRGSEEIALASKLEAFKKLEKPSDKQKEEAAAARKRIAVLKFERIANKRIPRVLAGIAGIGSLGGAGYVSSAAQREAIKQALENAVNDAMQKLGGSKQEATGFKLPTT